MRVKLRRDYVDHDTVHVHFSLPDFRAVGRAIWQRVLWLLVGALLYRAYLAIYYA